MKALLLLFSCLLAVVGAQTPASPSLVLVPADQVQKPVPMFFSATAKEELTMREEDFDGFIEWTLQVHQGIPERFSVGLSGEGDVYAVESVEGPALLDWAVRKDANNTKSLDLRPVLPADSHAAPKKWIVRAKVRSKWNQTGEIAPLLPAPGAAMGFSATAVMRKRAAYEMSVVHQAGWQSMKSPDEQSLAFASGQYGLVKLKVRAAGSESAGVSLVNARVTGVVDPAGSNVGFILRGTLRVREAGKAARLFGSGVALTERSSGDGWHVRLVHADNQNQFEIVGERTGDLPLELPFAVPVQRDGDWRRVNFSLPSGVVVPVELTGLGEQVAFDPEAAIVPEHEGTIWRGYLPATGNAELAWKQARTEEGGALFFSSSEVTEVRLGRGLLKQSTWLSFRVLQGRLPSLDLPLEGPGEVLSVDGDQVVGWKVREEGGKRMLEVKLSRPMESTGMIRVSAQSSLGNFPVRAEPLRILPEGGLRHSGFLRVGTDGAVKLEVIGAEGLMQLAPEQFPQPMPKEGMRQVFVYRFPSAKYKYAITAEQVMPEIAVQELTIYELAEADRRIRSDLELDIREAPLREWEIMIPADFAVASVQGAAIADFSVAQEAREGMRALKLRFREAIEGRQLISLLLEKNAAAEAGTWGLPVLGFPEAKSQRGFIGITSVPGFRVVPSMMEKLGEVPLSYFPKQVDRLQQSFRVREAGWKAEMKIEALGQSIQADVFHLYSLKQGAAYGSVLVNYFVVGAPANEWRLRVPAGMGNLEVTGQNVGRDWRREGDTLIVPLSRPALGAATVLISFEQPMSARGGELKPGEIVPLNVQSERGYIQVVSQLQVHSDERRSSGSLLSIDPAEIPAEFRLLTNAPTLSSWQYARRDIDLALGIEWFQPGQTVEQVVEYGTLDTRISRDGQLATEAKFFVKTKGSGGLRMRLPKEMSLWQVKVDGASVNARVDQEEVVIPVAARTDPNDPVEITVSYGGRAESRWNPVLEAPTLAAPVVIGEWTVHCDSGRGLMPRGGAVKSIGYQEPATGFQSIGDPRLHGALTAWLVLVVGAITCLRLGAGKPLGVVGLVCGVFAVLMTGFLVFTTAQGGWQLTQELRFESQVVSAGQPLSIPLAHVGKVRAVLVPWGAVLAVIGIALLVLRKKASGFLGSVELSCLLGMFLLFVGILAQHGGAALFFALLVVGGLLFGLWPAFLQWKRTRRSLHVPGSAVMGVLALSLALGSAPLSAQGIGSYPELESIRQDWIIRDNKLRGTMDLRVRGKEGDSILLLRAPAVMAEFSSEGMRVAKTGVGSDAGYVLVLDRAGTFTGSARFEMPLADPARAWSSPVTAAALQAITVRWDQAGWEFRSPQGAQTKEIAGLSDKESGTTLILQGGKAVDVQAVPKRKAAATEPARFFVETSNLYLPGPGVVTGRYRVKVRPSQGQVETMTLQIPEGFTVGEVGEGPVGSWRFDPQSRQLRVVVEPAQTSEFSFVVEAQQGTESLPVELKLAAVRVADAAGEVGTLGLAFGDDAQTERIESGGMSPVNLDDFDVSLVPKSREGKPLAVLQKAFRFGTNTAPVTVRVAPVAPEIRVESVQRLSLGEERMVLAADLTVRITRAGVFRLAVELPPGLEVESATSPALRNWAEVEDQGKRILMLHLQGKTIGVQTIALSLSSTAPGAQKSWSVPRLLVRDAMRQTGTMLIVPDRGLQVRAVERKNVSQRDPRDAGVMKPGALAFAMLESDWNLQLAVESLAPWVTARVLQEVSLREGQAATRVAIFGKIENAAVKTLRVRIPGLDAAAAATVRASGPMVSDVVAVAGEEGLWEIRFVRGVAGEVRVDLEYARQAVETTVAEIRPVEIRDLRQSSYFVVVRVGGRLEATVTSAPRGWEKSDWAVVQSVVPERAKEDVPVMSYRVAEVEGPLALQLQRHALANAVRIRVSSGRFTTLVSPEGATLTAADLSVEVVEKSKLQMKLPSGASLYRVQVNGEDVPLVREGDNWLFYVHPSPEADQPAKVEFVYSVPISKQLKLEGPMLGVPLESLTWRVLVPEGYRIDDYKGDFELVEKVKGTGFGWKDYSSVISNYRGDKAAEAARLLDQANAWLQAGEQEKASRAFSNVARSSVLDEASNEDARVQLQQLKSEQAVMGLNTRRQRLYLSKRAEGNAQENRQMEQAANDNPILQGHMNYDPGQVGKLMEGNTADENNALKAIAQRIVLQQLAAEPAPVALDVTFPERGTAVIFSRSLQVVGDAPLALRIELEPVRKVRWVAGVCLAAAVAVLGLFLFRKKAERISR